LIQPYGWQGCLTQHAGIIWGGTSGGPCPVQRSADGAILWSYGSQTLTQTVAVNQALAGTGIQVRGYNYSWDIKNANAGGGQAQTFDPLTITTRLYNSTNADILEQKTHDYSYRINDWTTFAGTEEFKNRYSLASLGNFQVAMTSRDVGYWAGYYGPEIRNINVSLRYSTDICLGNPLASPECPGYQEAYRQQQCAANPLFDTSCPGYAGAYFQVQCTNSPLYNPACPGYQQAYFTQQCSINALYNPECPGYQQAYFTQQCSINTLYNSECPGYKQAYFNQQCQLSPLYNTQCPGYEQAYFNQQCTLNIFYNSACPGYEQAYFTQQCNLNQLYSPQCPGYQQAYFTQQCNLNQLYSPQCSGYQQAYLTQQCNLTQLYSPQCPGYQAAYQAQVQANACKAAPQSSPQCPGYQPPAAIPAATTVLVQTAPVQQDAVAAATEVPVVADPVVNQVLATTQSNSSTAAKAEPLGQGLQIPGFSPTRPGISTGAPRAREQARQQAFATVNRAQTQTLTNEQKQQQETLDQIANVPGFSAYQSATIPDAPFYQTRDIYRGVVIRDNARAQRALSQRSDRLHREMVDEQYSR